MIGQDFNSTGLLRHVTRRIGDAKGHPFPAGAVKVCCVELGVVAVLTTENTIIIYNLRGYAEHKYYPLSVKEDFLKRQASINEQQLLLLDRPASPEDDWQLTFLKRVGVSVTDLTKDAEENSQQTPYSFIDVQPTNLCKVANRNAIAITDARFRVHILDLDTQRIVESFGKGGFGPGEFVGPTSVATLPINVQCARLGAAGDGKQAIRCGTFVFVGDSQATQKIRVFWPDYSQAAEVGGLGPALGQFQGIASMSCFDPKTAALVSLRRTEATAEPSEATSFGLEKAAYTSSKMTSCKAVAASKAPGGAVTEGSERIAPASSDWTAPDSAHLPPWYRGQQHPEDLEAMLYEDSFAGNFLVAQRRERMYEPVTYTDEHDLDGANDDEYYGGLGDLPTGREESSHQGSAGRAGSHQSLSADSAGGTVTRPTTAETDQFPAVDAGGGVPTEDSEDNSTERIFDILCITRSKTLDHIVVREEKNPGRGSGFYVSNSVSPMRVTYPCILDLLRAQRQHSFTLGGDTRPFVYVAVCDQGNYRVQVFCFYWTHNFLFRPELKLAYVVGGANRSYVELFEPTSVAYTPTGELAVCDAATCKVHILSPLMDVVRTIAIPFCSMHDMPLQPALAPRGNGVSLQKTLRGHQGSIPASRASTMKPILQATDCATTETRTGSNSNAAGTASTTGMDYLEYLTSSPASTIAFTDRELHPERYEHESQPKTLSRQASRSSLTGPQLRGSFNSSSVSSKPAILAHGASSLSAWSGSFNVGEMGSTALGSKTSLSRAGSQRSVNFSSALTSTSGDNVKQHPVGVPPPLAQLRSAQMSSKLVRQDSQASQLTQDSGSISRGPLTRTASNVGQALTAPGLGSVRLPRVATRSAIGNEAPITPNRKRNNAKYLSTYNKESKLSPEAVAEAKKKKLNRQPCSVSCTADGRLVVGYRSGGLLVYAGYEVYPVGTLRRLQTSCLELVVSYLDYSDVETVRKCCTYLHNFTKELRLSWRLFGPERPLAVTRAVALFIASAKLDGDGVQRPQFPLCDCRGLELCPRFLKQECEDAFCVKSHQPAAYDRVELARLQAYLVYTDVVHAVTTLFGARFLWRYEAYIEALYDAYGADRKIAVRHDPMTRAHETRRHVTEETARVLYFSAYLELLTLLEEQSSGSKDIHEHKLFRHLPRKRFVPKVDYSLDAIERRMVVDPCEQYGRPIDVPHKRGKGKKLITIKGMEDEERRSNNPVEEHCAVFNAHVDKAASLINRMFS